MNYKLLYKSSTSSASRGGRVISVTAYNRNSVSIDCNDDEIGYANNMYEVSELDFLICNEPMSYVRLLLSGKTEEYLRNNTDYTPLSDMR